MTTRNSESHHTVKLKGEVSELHSELNVRSGDESPKVPNTVMTVGDCDQVMNVGDGDKVAVKVESEAEDARSGPRDRSLSSIIDQLRCANKTRGHTPREQGIITNKGESGSSGGGAARCYDMTHSPRAPPAPAPPAPAPRAPPALVKAERLSPNSNRSRSTGSRSRSATPSTSSYPGTPPERGTPPAPPAPPRPPPEPSPRICSDLMRSLAARYHQNNTINTYLNRVYSIAGARGAEAEEAEAGVGGLWAKLSKHQGGPRRLPAFPAVVDMSCTKTLLAISRNRRTSRLRSKRRAADHCPLDLSAGADAKKTRAASPGPELRGKDEAADCLCAEARARVNAWSVDDVFDFVSTIDICAEYASNFREQSIDGSGLPLLTEEHLTGLLQMKLGPALKLRAVLSRRLEPCAACQPAAPFAPRINGSLKSEPRSNTTSPS